MGQQTDEQNTTQFKRNEMMEKRFDDMERAMNNKDTEQNRQMSTLKGYSYLPSIELKSKC